MGNLDRLSRATASRLAGVGLDELKAMNTDKALCSAVLCTVC